MQRVYFNSYIQKLNELGDTIWERNGARVAADGLDYFDPVCVGDGSGGAVVLAVRSREDGSGRPDNRIAQWIDNGGLRRLGEGGLLLDHESEEARVLSECVVSDTAGGAIMLWRDYPDGAAAQRVTCVEPAGTDRDWGSECVGSSAPSTDWYLPEGSTGPGFETWVCVENPGTQAAQVELTYMTESGPVPGPEASVPALSRATFNVADTVPGHWSVSTHVHSDRAVVAERAMYGENRRWGHDSLGLTNMATDGYLAEGSTGPGFETWVLVQNPGTQPAEVTLEFMTPTGKKGGTGATVPANSRKTFNLADFVPGEWEVSTHVRSTRPVVAERAVYGTGRTWGHDHVWVESPAEKWYLAEGSTGLGFETWVCVENPNDQPANLTLTFMTPSGEVEGPSATVGANSRHSFNLAESIPGEWSVSTKVESDRPVVVERAMYGQDRTWAHDSAGATASATTWYLAEGSTGPGFETWVLIQNPSEVDAVVKLTYMTEGGTVPGPEVLVVAGSRVSLNAGEMARGRDSLSTLVESDAPVVVERAVYGSAIGQ
ncbi:MAG: DUF5719 family protein [Actinomycetota bacterium]